MPRQCENNIVTSFYCCHLQLVAPKRFLANLTMLFRGLSESPARGRACASVAYSLFAGIAHAPDLRTIASLHLLLHPEALCEPFLTVARGFISGAHGQCTRNHSWMTWCVEQVLWLCSSSTGRHLQRIRVTLLACVDQILPPTLREQIEPLLQLPLGSDPREQVCDEAFWAEAERASKLDSLASSPTACPRSSSVKATRSAER